MRPTFWILPLFALSVFASPALAQTVCEMRSEAAGKIMEARLVGVPLAAVLKTFAESDLPDSEKNEMRLAVIKAYDSPDYRSEDAQKRAIVEFSNQQLLNCLKTNDN